MLYYEANERRSKVIAGVATGVYVALLVVLMLVIKFDMTSDEYGEGILIDFGDTEQAAGLTDPDDNTAAQQNTSVPNYDPDEILTQDFEDAPEVASQNRPQQPQQVQRPATATNNRPQSSQQQTTTEEPVRQVNPNAMFPSRTQGSQSASQGNSEGAGNQGAQEGSPGGSPDGTGGGGGGHGFSLAGRSIMGSLPTPSYGANKSGRVVVEIVVNASGAVVGASYRARGSTTNDSELVTSALRAAQRSKFNAIDGEGDQTGTITYNFTLK